MKIGDAVTWTSNKVVKWGVVVVMVDANVPLLDIADAIDPKYIPDASPASSRIEDSFIVYGACRDKKGKLKTAAYWPSTKLTVLPVKLPLEDALPAQLGMVEACLAKQQKKITK